MLEILHFKEYGNLAGQQHLSPCLENQNFVRYGIAGNINNNISLHFRLCLGKTNNKSFLKNPKNFIWGHFGPFFCINCGNNDVPRKKGSVSFKKIPKWLQELDVKFAIKLKNVAQRIKVDSKFR